MERNKIVAAVLAFFFGGFGVHKFYLGDYLWGFIYLFFCLTGIPAIVAFIEGVAYIIMSQDEFDRNFNQYD